MAEVNGRVFLNNASLGIYGEAVRSPSYRDAKLRTLLQTAGEVVGPNTAATALRLIDDLDREHRNFALVLVSNNPYALERAWTAPCLEVTGPAVVHAGIDGEAVDLSPPLRFAIRPAALRVRIAAHHARRPAFGAPAPPRFTPPH